MSKPDWQITNDLFRALMKQTNYLWVWMKLNSARLYLLEQQNRGHQK